MTDIYRGHHIPESRHQFYPGTLLADHSTARHSDFSIEPDLLRRPNLKNGYAPRRAWHSNTIEIIGQINNDLIFCIRLISNAITPHRVFRFNFEVF